MIKEIEKIIKFLIIYIHYI